MVSFRETELDATTTLAEFVCALLTSDTEQLITNDLGVQSGADDETVHQARVATRRLRSDLAVFRSVLVRDDVTELRGELRWLGALLGELRDSHVLRARFDEDTATLDHVDHAAAAGLFGLLDERQAVARERLLEAMSGERYGDLITTLNETSAHPPFRDSAAVDDPALPQLSRRARRAWRRVRRRVDHLDPMPDLAELHELRKEIKRMRYTAQAATRLGADAKPFAKQLGRAQEHLGDLQDTVVAMSWLTDAVERVDAPAAYLAGRLCQVAAVRQRELHATWREPWDRLDRPALRRWMR